MDVQTTIDTSVPATDAYEHALRHAWCTSPEVLDTILTIARRQGEGAEAVAMRLGRPLRNTRTVTMRSGVAVIPVLGPLFPRANMFTEVSGATSVETLALDIQAAIDSPEVHSIVLDVASPGGAATGIWELARNIRAAREAKPVVAYVGDQAASAAYWLASAASEVVIAGTGLAGSIGVVAGVPVKDDPNRVEIVSAQSPNKRVDVRTDAGRAQVQRMVDDLANVFVAAVADNRGVDPETVLSDFGQGSLFVGEHAVEAGLADRVGTLESVIAGLSGESTRAISMTAANTIDISAINREYIAEHHPAVAQAFRAEGLATAKDAIETAKDAGRAEGHAAGIAAGAEAERERLVAIDGVFSGFETTNGAPELLAKLKADPDATEGSAAKALLQLQRDNQSGALAAFKGDAPKAPAPAAAGDIDEGADADFDALVATAMADHELTKAKAMGLVAREHPAVHQAWLRAKQPPAAA